MNDEIKDSQEISDKDLPEKVSTALFGKQSENAVTESSDDADRDKSLSEETVKATVAVEECIDYRENVAVENEWLEFNYVKDKYIEGSEEKTEEPKGSRLKEAVRLYRERISVGKGKAIVAGAAVVLLIVAAVLTFTLGGVGESAWWNEVRVGAMNVFGIESPVNRLDLSVTTGIDSIENGDVIVKGGRLVLTLSDGTVGTVTENSVTIDIDGDTQVVYSNVYDIAVVGGQQVGCYEILGRYEEMTVINVYYKNQKVTEIVEANGALIWQS